MSSETTKRVAIVTGGRQRIGRRTAELLAELGYRLAIIDLHLPADTVKAVEFAGGEALGRAGLKDKASVCIQNIRTRKQVEFRSRHARQ